MTMVSLDDVATSIAASEFHENLTLAKSVAINSDAVT